MEKFNEIINGDKPVLVDFFAQWCGPCKMMGPVLKELKDKIGDKASIIKIDIDNPANQALVAAHNVRSVPTLILFRRGQILWRQSGAMNAEGLQQVIEQHAG